MKLLQLIDKRQTFPQKSIVRKKNAQPLKFNIKTLIQAKTETILLCPQIISKKYLNTLASKIYRVLFYCVKNNTICSGVLKNYSGFLGSQLVQYKEVGQLLKEVFRDSTEVFTQSTVNDFQKWAQQLHSLNEKEENWVDQTLILKIISSLCVSQENGVRKYQLVVEKFIFDKEMYFIDLCDIKGVPQVKFIPIDESILEFFSNNPTIDHMRTDSTDYVPLSSLTPLLQSYLCATFHLLCTIALSRNHSSIKKIISHYNFDPDHLLNYIKNPDTHIKLKISFLFLLRTLFIDIGTDLNFSQKNCRIFEWDENSQQLVTNSPVPCKLINDVIGWTEPVWSQNTLEFVGDANESQLAKFVIQILSLIECLIESEYLEYSFIERVCEGLAKMLPNYSSESMVKIKKSSNWSAVVKEMIASNSVLEQELMGKVLKLFSLISKVKLAKLVEAFVMMQSFEDNNESTLAYFAEV